MHPSVADVLQLPEVQAGQPVVLAGAAGLHRPVRWVHVLELSHVEGLLRGGELVLSTGVALPTSNEGLRRYVDDLQRHHVSGLVLQLGERWVTLPPALLQAADRVELPVVGLESVVPFVAITESVHSSIVSTSYAELQASERIHDQFARLGTEAAPVQAVLDELSALSAAPVVYETLDHRVLAAATAGRDGANVLGDWDRRSRRAAGDADGPAGPEGWLTRPVRARGSCFGRLVLQPGPGVAPTRLQTLALERAAAALALGRLLTGDGPQLQRRAHGQLLADLVAQRFRTEQEAHLMTQAAGVPTLRRSLTGLAVATEGETDPEADLSDVLRAAERVRAQVLAAVAEHTVAVLLVTAPGEEGRAAITLADAVHREIAARGRRAAVGRGATVTSLAEVRSTLGEAGQAARAGLSLPAHRSVVALSDVGVHGLLAQLVDDGRLHAYVERQLGPLLTDEPGSRILLAALRAFLEQGGNKSSAAAVLHVSRPALYGRLDQVATTLSADLDDPTTRLSLHLALAARDTLQR